MTATDTLGATVMCPNVNAPPRGSFAAVTRDMLCNTAAVVAWRSANVQADVRQMAEFPFLADHVDMVFVLGAAERALEIGDNPAALFVDTVKNGHRERITLDQEDRARRRWQQFLSRPHPSKLFRSVAHNLARTWAERCRA